MGEESREDPEELAWGLAFPEATRAVPEVPGPRIDSHHVCMWTALWESLVGKPRGKDSRESHRSLDPRGGIRDTAATALEPRIDSHHVCMWTALWESLVGKPRGKDSRESHRSLDPRGGIRDTAATALEGKNSRRSGRISRGGALHRKGERNSRVVPPFQESPRCVSPFQRNLFSLHCLDVQAEDRLPPRVHVGQPCGKASWESLVGKTRGKTIDALIHGADCVTLLLPLRRKAQVHARIRDED
ncbi:hypothetical protein MJT46_008333 [Ovis ammon polii x Ovis aries]|nr:hypothetical protein MJT46_008333 [Ovis ammon polii x Ovis aries]